MIEQSFDRAHIDIRDLPPQAGARREWELAITADEPVGVPGLAVPAGQPFVIDVEATSMEDGVLVRTRGDVAVHGECARCLEAIDDVVTIDSDDMFFTPEAIERMRRDAGEDSIEDLDTLSCDVIELHSILTDAIVTQLPFVPLCRPDCEGLCEICGQRWDDLDEDHAHEVVDPRLAPLSQLLAGLTQAEGGTDGEAQQEKHPAAGEEH